MSRFPKAKIFKEEVLSHFSSGPSGILKVIRAVCVFNSWNTLPKYPFSWTHWRFLGLHPLPCSASTKVNLRNVIPSTGMAEYFFFCSWQKWSWAGGRQRVQWRRRLTDRDACSTTSRTRRGRTAAHRAHRPSPRRHLLRTTGKYRTHRRINSVSSFWNWHTSGFLRKVRTMTPALGTFEQVSFRCQD